MGSSCTTTQRWQAYQQLLTQLNVQTPAHLLLNTTTCSSKKSLGNLQDLQGSYCELQAPQPTLFSLMALSTSCCAPDMSVLEDLEPIYRFCSLSSSCRAPALFFWPLSSGVFWGTNPDIARQTRARTMIDSRFRLTARRALDSIA